MQWGSKSKWTRPGHLLIQQLVCCKSFQKLPPVFCHFLIFWCKLARCFLKHLHFGPLVTLQCKSLQNLTPVWGHLLRRVKVCRIIARWRYQSKHNFKTSPKQIPEVRKVKGSILRDLRLATTSYHAIMYTSHKSTYCLKSIFKWPSPLVGCGDLCGWSTMN